MRKAVMLLVMFAVAAAVAQKPKQSVAVYMHGVEPSALKGAHRIVGSELAKALSADNAYTAADRTPEALNIIEKEQLATETGKVDEKQILELGKQLKVGVLCVVEIVEAMGQYQLEVRLYNAKTAKEASNLVNAYGNLKDEREVAHKAREMAKELVSEKRKIADYTYGEIEANPDKAVMDYTAAIRQEPDEADYYFKRGYAYNQKKEYGRTIKDFSEAIRLAPKEAIYILQRGNVYYNQMEDIDRALADWDEAIRLDPTFASAYNNRGAAYVDKGENELALADFNRAIRLDPSDPAPYHHRGRLYEDQEDHAKAVENYSEAIRLLDPASPNLATAYSSRGFAYMKAEAYDSAIADFNQVIRLDPDPAEAYNNRGYAYAGKGDYERAMKDYNEALRLDPDLAVAYANKGFAYARQGNYEMALAEYDKAVRLDSRYVMSRGFAYNSKGDYAKAAADFEAYLLIDPNDTNIKNMLAEARQKAGSFGGGSAGASKAAAKAAHDRGKAAFNHQDFEKAIAEFTEAIRLDPNGENDYYFWRALLYHNAKRDYANAIADYTKGLSITPNDAGLYYGRAKVYMDKDDYANAIADYEACLRLEPNQDNVKEELARARKLAGSGGGSPYIEYGGQSSPSGGASGGYTTPSSTSGGSYDNYGQPTSPSGGSSGSYTAPSSTRVSYMNDSRLGGPSMGGGFTFANDHGGGIFGVMDYINGLKWSYTTPWFGFGGHVFLDLVYVELGIAYTACYGTPQQDYDDNVEKFKDTKHSFTVMGFSALLKYPIGRGGSVSAYPAAGIEYALALSGKTVMSDGGEWEWDGEYEAEAIDFSALWFKFGAGLDVALGERLFLRGEVLYGVRLPSKYENDAAKEYDETPVLGRGFTVKAGMGVNF